MVSWWLMAAVTIGFLFNVVASSEKLEKEHRGIEPSNSEIRRPSSRIISRSYPSRGSFYDEGYVKYDPSGLGFEIQKPQNLFDAFHQSDPFKPSSFDSELPWPAYPELKPNYHRELPRYVEPSYYPPSNRKPYYREENLHPTKDAHQYPAIPIKYEEKSPVIPIKYEEKSPYSCPKIAGYESYCQLAKDCAVWYDVVLTTPGTACKLAPTGNPGICCPYLPNNNRGAAIKLVKKNVKIERPCIDAYSVNSAAHAGQFQLRLMEEMEKHLLVNNVTVRPRSSSYTHLQFFQKATESQDLSRGALAAIETTRELAKRFGLTRDEAGVGLSKFYLKDTILSKTCPPVPVCDERTLRSPFRKMDGSCNNLKSTFWGQSRTPFQRVIVPDYADGVWLPRKAQDNGELPSARLVSVSVVLDKDSPTATETHWVMQYGQFINHDMSLTNLFRTKSSAAIQCCTEDGKLLTNPELIHPQCLPIKIPTDDPFFSKFGQLCMNFVRSTPAPRSDCSLGYGEQMNGNTHFLDQSNVYGSDDAAAAELRTFVKGGLKVNQQQNHHLDLLPPNNNTDTNCTLSKPVSAVAVPVKVKCFKAGDPRPNQTPNLAVTHTIFLREHNRLATELAYLNPNWEDERLYQVARRILIAQMQHITYNEWLPIVIGRAKMQELGLLPLQRGFSDDYDQHLNPSILNEFSAAAFRFGHSMVQGKHDLTNLRRKKEVQILLRQHFSKMQTVYTPGNLERFLIGLATQPSQNFDNYFTEEITNHLFEEAGKGFGLDLVSLNIQRGRERGIPGYNAFRSLCGLQPAKDFNDLKNFIPDVIAERFELLYDSVDDIDFFIAGVSERKVKGATMGPTFQCIVADQFLRVKRGDRFFYDLAGQTGSFSEEQLNEIRKTSFARLVCDNSNVLQSQPLIFKAESAINPVVSCESLSIPRLSLLPWQEKFEKPY